MRHLLSISLVASFAAVFSVARADTVVSTSTFNYTGNQQSYVVPAGTDYIVIKAWAAGGGEGVSTPGGGGGLVVSTFSPSPGLGLTVYVGGGGAGAGTGGWPGGGSAAGGGGAGGGGYSRVTGTGVEVVAGAGGGGGNGGLWGGTGGGGGGPNGEDGGGPGSTFGGGSTPSSAGAGGSGDLGAGSAGAYWQGGNSTTSGGGYIGGGGGGGYIGGGGGGTGSFWNGGGGGGGGSCYVNQQVAVTYYQASGNTPGGVTDSDYPGGSVACGGYEGTYANGHNGYVVIRAYKYASAPVFNPTSFSESFNCNQSVNYQIHAGGTPAPTYSASGLPSGLGIDAGTGIISGQCTSPDTYAVTLSATNSSGTAQASFTCTIVAPEFSASVSFSNSTPIPGEVLTITRSTWAKFVVQNTQNNMWRTGGPDPMGDASANQTMTYTIPSQTGNYTYRIRVIDNYSNFKDFDFAFTVVPPLISAPTSLQSSTTGSTFVSLIWSGATAQVGIDHYNIYRNGSFLTSTTGTSYTDSTVTSSTGYSYQVYVVDTQSHSSGTSPTLSLTTTRALEVLTPLP